MAKNYVYKIEDNFVIVRSAPKYIDDKFIGKMRMTEQLMENATINFNNGIMTLTGTSYDFESVAHLKYRGYWGEGYTESYNLKEITNHFHKQGLTKSDYIIEEIRTWFGRKKYIATLNKRYIKTKLGYKTIKSNNFIYLG